MALNIHACEYDADLCMASLKLFGDRLHLVLYLRTKGRSSMAVAEDLRPTATVTEV